VGQFWTPIFLKGGSLLHAGLHTEIYLHSIGEAERKAMGVFEEISKDTFKISSDEGHSIVEVPEQNLHTNLHTNHKKGVLPIKKMKG
jgi:hypothetical protein